MSIIAERTNEVAKLMAKVKDHCMCARFVDEGSSYLVIYPEGDFAVGGQRVRHDVGGKAKALEIMLSKMETHWTESYP